MLDFESIMLQAQLQYNPQASFVYKCMPNIVQFVFGHLFFSKSSVFLYDLEKVGLIYGIFY